MTPTQSKRVFAVVCAVFLLSVPWLYRYTARQIYNPDPFLYAQAAKEVLSGKRLYLEAWQDKPPLGILAYAVPQLFAPRSYAGICFFFGCCLVAQCLLFWRMFRSHRGAVLSGMLFIALFPITLGDFTWPSTEHFSNIVALGILLVGYTMFREQRFMPSLCATVGALVCLAFNVRQNTVVACLVPFMAILSGRQTLREKLVGLGVAGTAGLIMWGLILILVVAIGDWKGYLYTVFQYPRAYARLGNAHSALELARFLFSMTSLPMILALFLGIALGTRFRWFALSVMAAGVLGCLMPLRPFGHYWVSLFPYVALLIGVALAEGEHVPVQFGWACAGMFAVLVFPRAARQLVECRNDAQQLAYREVAGAVDRIAPAGATLMVVGPLGSESIQFASRLPAANTFSTAFQLNPPPCTILPRPIEQIFDEYLQQPPTMIVIHRDQLAATTNSPPPTNPQRLIKLLAVRYNYDPVATNREYIIEMRRGAPPQGTGATSNP